MTKLERLLDEYYQVFNESYPLMIVSDIPEEEIIDDIERCIESGVKAEPILYDDEADY